MNQEIKIRGDGFGKAFAFAMCCLALLVGTVITFLVVPG